MRRQGEATNSDGRGIWKVGAVLLLLLTAAVAVPAEFETRRPTVPPSLAQVDQSNSRIADINDGKSEARPANGSDYRVDTGDRVSVTVYQEADLSVTGVRVKANGHISYPLLGDLHVSGLTSQEVHDLVKNGLLDGYLKKPNVTVSIDSYRLYFIKGEVKRPGGYSYVDGLTFPRPWLLPGVIRCVHRRAAFPWSGRPIRMSHSNLSNPTRLFAPAILLPSARVFSNAGPYPMRGEKVYRQIDGPLLTPVDAGNEHVFSAGPVDEREMAFVNYWRIVKRFRWSILAIALIAGIIGVLNALSATSLYQAHARLLVKFNQPNISNVQQFEAMPLHWLFFETQGDIIKSRAVAERVVTRLGTGQVRAPDSAESVSRVSG